MTSGTSRRAADDPFGPGAEAWPPPVPDPIPFGDDLPSRERAAVALSEVLVGSWHTFTRLANARFGEHGFTAARVRVIAALASGGPIRMSALADQLGVTGRTVTSLVDGLEAEGVIARLPDPDDRRAIRLALTESGRAAVDQIHRLQAQVTEEIFAHLGADERRQLTELLTRFLDGHGIAARRP